MLPTPALARIIATALERARREGLDCESQTRRAVAAVQAVEPDLSEHEVVRLVARLRPE